MTEFVPGPADPPDGGLESGLAALLADQGLALFGVADLSPVMPVMKAPFPRAVSFGRPMPPSVMAELTNGPTPDYSRAYVEANAEIDRISGLVEQFLKNKGGRAWAVPASTRTDPVHIKGDFPHKTAATRAGLGWVGRHCQLITKPFGPWVRLGTVLTDLNLLPGKAVEKSRCGRCRICVDACPAGALKNGTWRPGLPREELLDARVCDQYKLDHFAAFNRGRNCGICTAVCPAGRKTIRKST